MSQLSSARSQQVSNTFFITVLSYRLLVIQVLKLPSWLPGMAFKRGLAAARECAKEYREKPFDYSMKKLVKENVYFLDAEPIILQR